MSRAGSTGSNWSPTGVLSRRYRWTLDRCYTDDVMAGKMDALYNRAAARDFLDIDAAITSGRSLAGAAMLDHLVDEPARFVRLPGGPRRLTPA